MNKMTSNPLQTDASHDISQSSVLSSSFEIDTSAMVEKPLVREGSVLRNVAGYIIVTEFCERLAYYGFAGSLVLFFQDDLKMTNAQADIQFSIWAGACYVTPLLGGYVADKYLGRYRAILVFSIIYVIGLIIIVLGANPESISQAAIFLGMYIVALGTGGIKPNVSTLGADQFDDSDPVQAKEKESFFNWFYFSINLGALISYSLVAYVCQYGLPFLGGQKWGFFVGWWIPTIFMALAIMVFVAGSPKYKCVPPEGSILERAVLLCYEALWTRRSVPLSGAVKQKLDRAALSNGGSFSGVEVHGMKLVARIAPFLTALIGYWAIYSQLATSFQNQACQMDLSLGGTEVPVSALQSFDTIAILILVPIFDVYIYPALEKNSMGLSMLQRMGLGFVFAALSMLVAGFVELSRLHNAPPPGGYSDPTARANISPCQNIDDYNPTNYQKWVAGYDDTDEPQYCSLVDACTVTTVAFGATVPVLQCISCNNIIQTSSLSVFAQVPQFLLVGTSEVLTSITSLQFFYSQAPIAMRSVSQALNLFMTALGSWVIIPLLLLVNANKSDQWVPANLDDGHLDYYFFLLAGLMVLNHIYFGWLSRDYVYIKESDFEALHEGSATVSRSGETHVSALQAAIKV
jgi:peptide/histidine transporter 3/4